MNMVMRTSVSQLERHELCLCVICLEVQICLEESLLGAKL